MEKLKFTDKIVAGIAVPERGERVVWDAEVSGLGLRLRSEGAKTWLLKRGNRRFSLGNVGDRKIALVRAEALGLLSEIASGKEPSRKARTRKPTVHTVVTTYITDHVKPRRRQSTVDEYQRLLDNHIGPKIGDVKADDLTARQVDKLMTDMKDTPVAGNKALSLLSASFAKAMRWGLRSPALGNPCVGTDRHETEAHEEYLELPELKIVLDAISEVASTPGRWHAGMCLRLLALTGCRHDEIRALLWSDIDFVRQRIDWDVTKTGKGHLMLHQAALEVLATIKDHDRRTPTKHVFRGADRRILLPKSTVYRAWADVKALAIAQGLDEKRLNRLRPHDLRHSFASLALSSGMTLDDVGRLLRHKDKRSTSRYARHIPSRELELAKQAQVFLPV